MVLARIAGLVERELTPASLYTMFDARRPTASPIDRWNRVASSLNDLPRAIELRRWLLPAYPLAVRELARALAREHARTPINLVISTSSAAIKGLRPPAGVPHLCYCHSPARYVWSVRDEYRTAGGLASLGLRLYGPAFRSWDRRTAANVTHFLANSTHTARLIERAYGRGATVVHPPVRTSYFTPDPSTPRRDFWLVVAALEPYKRVDLAIRAAGLARRPLVVAGAGSMRGALESLASAAAPGLVTFEGRVDDDRLRSLYRAARCLLFPQIEDFGIVAAEALACGTPVVARRDGGSLDMIAEGLTGAFFDEAGPAALADAAKRCPEPTPETSLACAHAATRFSEDRFDLAMRREIERTLGLTPGIAPSQRP